MAAPYPPAAAGGAPAASTEFKTRIELQIKCNDLPKMDRMSQSDPLCLVEIERAGSYSEIGRTEKIADNPNPDFVTSIPMDYCFEELQHLRFSVYDVDDSSQPLQSGGAQLIGSMEVNLGQIVANKSHKDNLSNSGKTRGTIVVQAEEVSSVEENISLTFSATHLDKKDFFGKSDPYLVFSRKNHDGSFSAVHKSPVIKNTLDPDWQPFVVTSQKLCNGDDNREIQIDCFDWDQDSADDLIGSCVTTLGALRVASLPLHLQLRNPKKAEKKKSYTNSGILHLRAFTATRMYSFIDYVSHGCEINFVVGIDFTGSNGNPSHPTSLHYIAPNQMNQYMQALWAVGSVCEQYDSDKLFPAFGFGAKIPPNQTFSDIFPLTFNYENPYVQGVQGVHTAYQQCLPQVALWGPTNAAPIVQRVKQMAEEAAKASPIKHYFVLLLLTDGVLTDMAATKEAIVQSSHLPMSIIIVGVGNADFCDMNVLDGDDGRLRSQVGDAARDIVQFVPFREFAQSSPAHLAKAVLAEVPQQLTDYMRMKKEVPAGM